MDLQEIRAIASEIAREAGQETLRYFQQASLKIKNKGVFDVVTEGDTASEAIVTRAITERFPTHHIIGEEGGGMGAAKETAEYAWHIDPIDGTTNYAAGIPYYSVSIALADKDNNLLVGVIYNPVTQELFSAAAGHGATLNGEPIHVTGHVETLQDAVLATGFPYHKATNPDNNIKRFNVIELEVRAVRCFGSAALDLAYVASGRLAGYWESFLNSWDCYAGILLVREAGGTVTDYDGNEANLTGRTLIATNGKIQAALQDMIQANG